jgi:hypothetical protein
MAELHAGPLGVGRLGDGWEALPLALVRGDPSWVPIEMSIERTGAAARRAGAGAAELLAVAAMASPPPVEQQRRARRSGVARCRPVDDPDVRML